jgi:ankyrin repeat protein
MDNDAADRVCALCCAPAAQRCGRCRCARYCSADHQREHWAAHRGACPALAGGGPADGSLPRDTLKRLARLCALGAREALRAELVKLGDDAARAAVAGCAVAPADAGLKLPPSAKREDNASAVAGDPYARVPTPREGHGHASTAALLLAPGAGGDVNAASTPSGVTPLMLLLHRGWPAGVTAAVARALKPDVAVRAADGSTALHVAARTDATGDVLRALLGAPDLGGAAVVDAEDASGATPLHAAAAAGHLRAVDALLDAGATFPDPRSERALAMARRADAARAAHLASLKPPEPQRRQQEGDGQHDDDDEPASDSDDEDAQRRRDLGALLPRSMRGTTNTATAGAGGDDEEVGGGGVGGGGGGELRQWAHPIHAAINGGHAGLVTHLLAARGVPVTLLQPTSGDTLLHAAAKCGHAGVLEAVMAAARDGGALPALLAAPNAAGATPLVDAIAARRYAAAGALLAAGADARAPAPDVRRDELPDALAMAVAAGQAGLVAGLTSAGADPNARNAAGETTFMLACAAGAVGIARALLAAGADARAVVPSTGETALHLLAQRSEDGASADEESGAGVGHDAPARRDTAALLLGAGADVNARTTLAGHTPVWLACFHGSPRLAAWLAAHGGDPTIADDGKNPSLAPVDAYGAPPLNEARRAYAHNRDAFAAQCREVVDGVRAGWAAWRQAQVAAAPTAAATSGTPKQSRE